MAGFAGGIGRPGAVAAGPAEGNRINKQWCFPGRAVQCWCWVRRLVVALGTAVVDKQFKRGVKNGKVSSVCSW